MNKIKLYLKKINDYMQAQGIKGDISFIKVFFDILVCNIKYGATISDYFVFRFYDKTSHARKTFMTAKYKNKFYSATKSDSKEREVIQNKDIFNVKFAKYLKRKSINIPEQSKQEFIDFVLKYETVFIKPIATGGGAGIIKIYPSKTKDLGKIYDDACANNGKCVVEAGIVQHPDMASIHPQSINSIRVSTIFNEKVFKIVFAELRCGTGDSFVDNHSSGGLEMHIDPDTGKVSSMAASKSKINIVKHPDTGVFLPGFQVPYWDKVVKLVTDASKEVEGIHYVGWDVAITPDDVCLIEANPSGDFNIYQESTQTGCKDEMMELLDVLK